MSEFEERGSASRSATLQITLLRVTDPRSLFK